MTTNVNSAAQGGRDQGAAKASPDLDKNNQQLKPPAQGGTSGNKEAEPFDAVEDVTQTMTTPQNPVSMKPQDKDDSDNEVDEESDEDDEDDDSDEEDDDEESEDGEDEGDEKTSLGSPAGQQNGTNPRSSRKGSDGYGASQGGTVAGDTGNPRYYS